MKCPHCSNDDPRLIEFLTTLTYVTPVVHKYLCTCCSKTFLVEPERTITVRKEELY